jgi:hypothetical protein
MAIYNIEFGIPAGADGVSPAIGDNGNWWIGDTDTGVSPTGTSGADGADGADGVSPTIGDNGNWWIGSTDTGVAATPTITASVTQLSAGSQPTVNVTVT